jgi:hypothetical protein
MISFRTSVAARRGIALLAVALAGAGTSAARHPAAPGLTYRVRMLMTPPEMPGMQMSPILIVGHASAMGGLSRFDIDSVSGQVPMVAGDYMLSLDSGRVVTVNPTSKSYSEGIPGLTALPPQLLAQASVQNVNVTTEKLGAGETMQGYATQKVRMTATYILNIMGQSLNNMTTVEMSLAELPVPASTPFDGAPPKEMLDSPMRELMEKTAAARKAIGSGSPLKTVTSTSITGPAVPAGLTTTTTVDLLDVKAGDVDPAVFKLPEGFTKKP